MTCAVISVEELANHVPEGFREWSAEEDILT
jgi:hypothetical protein